MRLPDQDPRVILETENRQMQLAGDRIDTAAKADADAIIYGETGTGKELAAHCIHLLGPRSAKPFVAQNCAALPSDLVERELFGHRRGAFTDAHRDAHGLFHAASGGTLFLDEIAELPGDAQAKLLRVVEDGRVRPLGETREDLVDVRILAACSGFPDDLVASGKLRADLFYRLKRIPIYLPPLRERREDIPMLAERLLDLCNRAYGTGVAGISPRAMDVLKSHDWPGNVRELLHVIEQAILLGKPGRVLNASHLPKLATRPLPGGARDPESPRTLREAEREAILSALQAAGGNRAEAARVLDIARSTLYWLLRKHGIDGSS